MTLQHRSGRLEVVAGVMFSGKSEELIRRVRRAQIARQRVQLFKPRIDDATTIDGIFMSEWLTISSVA